jgi:hypothetical protein
VRNEGLIRAVQEAYCLQIVHGVPLAVRIR